MENKQEEEKEPKYSLINIITKEEMFDDEFTYMYWDGEVTIDDYLAGAYQHLRNQKSESIYLVIKPNDWNEKLKERIENMFHKRETAFYVTADAYCYCIVCGTKYQLSRKIDEMHNYVND